MDVVTGGVDLNAKRAKTELNHVRKLVNDLDTLNLSEKYKKIPKIKEITNIRRIDKVA